MIGLAILISICYVITVIMVFLIYDRIWLIENKLKEIIKNQSRIRESINNIEMHLYTIRTMVSDIEDDIDELKK